MISFFRKVFCPSDAPLADQLFLLESVDVCVRRKAVGKIWVLAQEVQCRTQMRHDIVFDPLVRLLSDWDLEVRKKAAEALGSLSKDHAYSQNQVANLGRVAHWVRLLSDEVMEVRFIALMVMFNLSMSRQHRDTLPEAGAMMPLLALLSDGHRELRQKAAEVIRLLCYNHRQNQDRIAQSGGIESLVRLLSDGETEVRKWAAGALINVSMSAQNKERIVQAGAISPLVNLLADEEVSVRDRAVVLLSDLITNHENKERIAEAGGIGLLVGFLSSEHMELCYCAMLALLNLAHHHAPSKKRIAEAGGVVPLVRLLSHEHRSVCCCASVLLLSLAESAENKKRIAEAGGVAPLLSLFLNKRWVRDEALALKELALNTENQERISPAEGFRLC